MYGKWEIFRFLFFSRISWTHHRDRGWRALSPILSVPILIKIYIILEEIFFYQFVIHVFADDSMVIDVAMFDRSIFKLLFISLLVNPPVFVRAINTNSDLLLRGTHFKAYAYEVRLY